MYPEMQNAFTIFQQLTMVYIIYRLDALVGNLLYCIHFNVPLVTYEYSK